MPSYWPADMSLLAKALLCTQTWWTNAMLAAGVCIPPQAPHPACNANVETHAKQLLQVLLGACEAVYHHRHAAVVLPVTVTGQQGLAAREPAVDMAPYGSSTRPMALLHPVASVHQDTPYLRTAASCGYASRQCTKSGMPSRSAKATCNQATSAPRGMHRAGRPALPTDKVWYCRAWHGAQRRNHQWAGNQQL